MKTMTTRMTFWALASALVLAACSQETPTQPVATADPKTASGPLKTREPEPPKPASKPVFAGEFDFKGVKLGASEELMRKQFKPLYPYGFGYKTSSNFIRISRNVTGDFAAS